MTQRDGLRSPFIFRKADDGGWLRKRDGTNVWERLVVTEATRTICTGSNRNGEKRLSERIDKVWTWVAVS